MRTLDLKLTAEIKFEDYPNWESIIKGYDCSLVLTHPKGGTFERITIPYNAITSEDAIKIAIDKIDGLVDELQKFSDKLKDGIKERRKL